MANSDYTVRGTGTVTPSAKLAAAINPLAANISMLSYSAPGGLQPAIGMGVMIDDEIMRVTSVSMPQIGVARGCADTVPASHAFGTKVWFFTQAAGTDGVEYMATETIGVKLLMRSNAGTMGVENSPPNALTFNRRFARPYPPGNLKVNGLSPFNGVQVLDEDTLEFVITWAHRDRITQGDQLIGHEVGDIGPEPGTTYVLRVYNDAGTLMRTVDNISGTTVTYSVVQAMDDLNAQSADGTRIGHLTLHSQRGTYDSFQGHRVNFSANLLNVVTGGWGDNWGGTWGTRVT